MSIFQRRDVRIPADPQDFETTQDRSALPPVEFTVGKTATVTTFRIKDRQFVAQRGSTASYRIYFLPAAFSPVPTGASVTVAQSPVLGTFIRRAGQRVASLVADVSAPGRGDALTATDTQFFGKAGYYYCVAVNNRGIEAPPEHIVAAP